MQTTVRLILWSAGAGLALAAHARAADPATARDHYYAAAGKETPAWRGVRSSILLRRDPHGGNPAVHEVSENYAFHSGDSFRLRLESNFDGYLYLFLRGGTGEMKMLFPYAGAAEKSNRMKAFERHSIPALSADWFRFDQDPGIEQVFLFLSPAPIESLERLQKDNRTTPLRDLERMIARNGPPEAMRFDEENPEDKSQGGATYYAEKNTAQRQFLVRRIELMHDAPPAQ